MVWLHEEGDSESFSFCFCLTVQIRGEWSVELSRRRLRQKYTKRSRTPSSCPTVLVWTAASKKTPHTPAPPAGEEDDSTQRDYNLPIPLQKAIPDDYARDDKDDKKYEKVTPRTLQPHPLLPPEMQMVVPGGSTI